jgi:methylenetetrahydrofolate dehydrogenase (NADP+)/methenyltetrahydrofolate cyclohydrolase
LTQILDGKALARDLNQALVPRIDALDPRPGLAVVRVGEDPASVIYVNLKTKAATRLGLVHRQIVLPDSTSESELLGQVKALNDDDAIDGILVQVPLPKQIDAKRVLDSIAPHKDVDGFHPHNVGLLSQGRPRFVSCTPKGVMHLLRLADAGLEGAEAIVIGRSNIVGRPMVMLLEQAGATVTVCHSKTKDLPSHVRRADVLVAAVGSPEIVRGEWVKSGAVVIDVGVNRLDDGTIKGDVEYEAAKERARAITPVPGGVGPMTIAMLMENTVTSAELRRATRRS